MISKAMFEVIVASFCSWHDPHYTADYKLKCTESMLNCSFNGYNDGSSTTNELVDSCREKWIEESKRRGK